MSVKPAAASRRRYSSSLMAPATQAAHASGSSRTAAGSGAEPLTTMSASARRPPGLRTRNASRSTASLSGARLTTQLLITTSTARSGSGTAAMSPFRKRAFATPAWRRFSSARASMASVASSP